MTEHPLLDRARQAPESPGVYQFVDARSKVIYIGKAKHLKKRVLSYFTKGVQPRTAAMLARARRLEFVVTATEIEALILENRLIKQHRPRYNINLRDDKTYPYVKLTTAEPWPRALLTRRIRGDGHRYFGPFLGHAMAARVMDLIRTRSQVRTCAWDLKPEGTLPRPCLYFDMGACLGPCVAGLTTREAYARAVDEVVLLLEGRHQELRPRLETQMWGAAERQDYERAGRYRDLLRALDELERGQHVELAGSGSVDVIGMEGDGVDATIVLLAYRDGTLVDKREFHWEGLEAAPDAALLGSFMAQYYDANPAVPERIEAPLLPDDAETLRAFLTQRRGAAVRVTTPQRGERARVLDLARDNAREAFRLRFRHPLQAAERVANSVAVALSLPSSVNRIECFDISHTAGEAQVASLVVWDNGGLRKAEYRSFNVRAGGGADDPAAMAEAVGRRYRRRLSEGGRLPDLVLVDGGPIQLAAARTALAEVGCHFAVASLAKRMEEIFLPDRAGPLHLEANDHVRLLFQRLRDEAHRFAITRHRRRRRARRLATQLLAVPGIGPQRAKALLERFGSVDGVRAAAVAELAAVVGAAAAVRVATSLEGEKLKAGLDENGNSR